MSDEFEHYSQTTFKTFATDWDRLLNVYTIQELPNIPADGDPGSESVPLSIKVIREFLLEAAGRFATEIWFDYSPGNDDTIDACYNPSGEGTVILEIPRHVFFLDDEEIGIFGPLLNGMAVDGKFAIHVSEFRDKPKRDPFDSRGRIIQPPVAPLSREMIEEEKHETPGVTETLTIRAFQVSLKGHEVPGDLVIQICPRFWHMPSGFQVG